MRTNETKYTYFKAIKNGNGYSDTDKIVRVTKTNSLSADPDLILEVKWFNQTTFADIYEPIDLDLIKIN